MDTEEFEAVKSAMRTAYFLAKEGIPTSKYPSLIKFMREDQECHQLDALMHAKNASYDSRQTADEFHTTLAEQIEEDILEKIKKSNYYSVLVDETTDIRVREKMVLYVRYVDSQTFTPKTTFLANVYLQGEEKDGKLQGITASVIYNSIVNYLDQKGLDKSKLFSFGSDGASVLTGRKNGVATKLKENLNPHMISIHCMAHRLNLVTSKAAENVPYIKNEFQEAMTNLFYYLHKSAVRTANLANVQKVFDLPEMKIKKIHEIRWCSFYEALKSVYLSWAPIVTFLRSEKTSKAQEILKVMLNVKFVYCLHAMMDILPAMATLSLKMQQTDLDLGAVRPCLDKVKKVLSDVKKTTSHYAVELQKAISKKSGKFVYKCQNLGGGSEDVKKYDGEVRDMFVKELQEALDRRFPTHSTQVSAAFEVLALKPIEFLSKEDLVKHGDKQLGILTEHYGTERICKGVKSAAVVNPDFCRNEWIDLKNLVLNQGYPRDKFVTLYQIINKYHNSSFPNILKLAQLAMILPLHTADCERGFSAMSNIHDIKRNRLEPQRLQRLLMINIQGPDREEFDFNAAVNTWSSKKERRIFENC